MSYLTEEEAVSAISDVQALLEATEETATLHSAVVISTGSFAGEKPVEFNVPGNEIPVLVTDKQPNDLLQVDHDYMLSILPDVMIKDQDVIELREGKFQVVDIQIRNLFGTVTHQDVAVKKMRSV